MKSVKTFETYDVDLAAFLMLHGLKFIEGVLEKTSDAKPRVVMRFFDEKEAARDLERVFMSSDCKQYRDYHKYLLREIHRTLRGL
jgi:hypothetical protein